MDALAIVTLTRVACERNLGSSGLAWYQWKKHGRCTGLAAQDYFALTRAAANAIAIPAPLDRLGRDVSLPAKVVEDAFIEANPDLTRDGITVTIPLFVVVASIVLRPLAANPVARVLYTWRWSIVALWFTAVILLCLVRFWSYWSTLL